MPFPVSEDDLAAAEAALGVEFPPSFRRKMLADNGGELVTDDDEFELFTVLDRTDQTRMARTSASDIVRENEQARAWAGFPAEAVAIASNGAGDYLVLRADADGIHRWDHETGALELVADDVAELL